MTDAMIASLVVLSAILSLVLPMYLSYWKSSQNVSESVVEGVTPPPSSNQWCKALEEQDTARLYGFCKQLLDGEYGKDIRKPYLHTERSLHRVQG